MAEMSLGRAVTRVAQARPDEPAVIDGCATLSWAELDRWSNALARLLTDRGVGRDDLVTTTLPSGVAFVALTVAVWKAGATPQPLSPLLPRAELDAVVAAGRPALVLDALPDVPGVDDSPVADRWAGSWKAPVSSGSTGTPKIIYSAAPARIDPDRPTAPYIPSQAVQLTPAPLHHAAAFLFAMRGLTLGHTLVTMPRFDAAGALDLIERHRVTWAVLAPSAMHRIWRTEARAAADVSSLASVLHLGAACPQWLKRAWLDWLGPERVDEIYSGTESIGVTHIGGSQWLARPGSVGRPAQGTSLRILDEAGRELPSGTVGRVHLRPRGGAGSTYRYSGSAAAESVDGHESLGDLGWVDDDGYLFLADREADVVHTVGGPVYPSMVEAVLDAHPDVRTSAAFGDGGVLCAVVDVAGSSTTSASVLDWCRGRLDVRLVPERVTVVHEPVRDDFGKVRRRDLAS